MKYNQNVSNSPLAPSQRCEQLSCDPAIVELCNTTKNKTDLTEDEVLLLAIAAGQAALARYVEPDNATAEETINRILAVLDHEAVIEAMRRKSQELLSARQQAAQGAIDWNL